MAKSLKSYFMTPPHPHGHVMSVSCEHPLDELTVQVWLLYKTRHLFVKYGCPQWQQKSKYGKNLLHFDPAPPPGVCNVSEVWVWNTKLTETQIFRELSIEIESSLIELKRYQIELTSSLIQLESFLIQLVNSLYMYN